MKKAKQPEPATQHSENLADLWMSIPTEDPRTGELPTSERPLPRLPEREPSAAELNLRALKAKLRQEEKQTVQKVAEESNAQSPEDLSPRRRKKKRAPRVSSENFDEEESKNFAQENEARKTLEGNRRSLLDFATPPPSLDRLKPWFTERGYEPWPFQTAAWNAFRDGKSGLIHVPTGSGKTLAAFGGPLSKIQPRGGLQVLYLSPLRAVIRDIEKAIREFADTIDPNILIETRTGDTATKVRTRQLTRLPDILLTTPESLSLMLTRSDSRDRMKDLQCVILDEWHELMSSKRGLQVELGLSHLLPFAKNAQIWALSGTISNLNEAAQTAVGIGHKVDVISQVMDRSIQIETVVPADPLQIPWIGHLGLRLLPEVLSVLDEDKSTLIFTNTRSQAEYWYQAILDSRPEMAGAMALHHSSLDMKKRLYVEDAIKSGEMKWVVCTSSLDLGVDFGLVERVIQIGSAKGVARTMQRAGRANHRPNEPALLFFVPTQAMEVAEMVALKQAIVKKEIEGRPPWRGALDVLEQHVVSCACGGPILPDEIYQEVRTRVSYQDLSREAFDWVIDHLTNGGALHHYSQFKKLIWIELEGKKYLHIANPMIARLHRQSIGTIVSDTTIQVLLMNRQKIGNIEERYLARLAPGEKFLFAGRTLQLVLMKDLKAYVKPASGKTTQTPRWLGGKLPISRSVCHELREVLHRAALYPPGDDSRFAFMSASEKATLQPLFETQTQMSKLPLNSQFMIEFGHSREGSHAFLFPFEGRLVHEGLAALLAWRLSQLKKGTFGLSMNDYGIELLSEDKNYPLQELIENHWTELLRPENLLEELAHSIRLGEYARRHFREIARVSGLVFQGYRGSEKSSKQMQVSSSLLFDVLLQHEPQNLLLQQAEKEVLERQFEATRMLDALERIRGLTPLFVPTKRFSPLAYPLLFERMAATVSTEKLSERLERMKKSWLAENGARR